MTRREKFPDFLTEWREINGEDFTPIAYLGQPDAFPFVVATQWLYAPDFVEYRGGIFRAELPLGIQGIKRDILDSWFKAFDGDILKAEQAGNMLNLWGSLNSPDTDQFDDDNFYDDLMQLATTLGRAWDALLRVEFPDRCFQVDVYDHPDDGPQVTFYSRR